MKKLRFALMSGTMTLAFGLGAILPAQADITASLKSPAGAGYYKEFGGKAGITSLINTFVGNVAADKRINFYFAHTNIPALKAALVDQVCDLEGGPCQFDMSMQQIHGHMGVSQNAFNALAEDMIRAMDTEQIPTGAQNHLLAQLAAMEPRIVTK